MPRGKQPIDPRILDAIPRIKAHMLAHGHTQPDVERLTGQPQSQISRLLAGKRTRVTDPVREICKYANIDLEAVLPISAHERRLSYAVGQVIMDNPCGAAVLARVIEALAPTLALLRDPPAMRADKEHP